MNLSNAPIFTRIRKLFFIMFQESIVPTQYDKNILTKFHAVFQSWKYAPALYCSMQGMFAANQSTKPR